MTIKEQYDELRKVLINELCKITDIPDNWLPHTVFVEDVGDCKYGHGVPVYEMYKLVSISGHNQTCILMNPVSGMEQEANLSEINIDWLMMLWGWYWECKGNREPNIKNETRVTQLSMEIDIEKSNSSKEVRATSTFRVKCDIN